MANKRHQFSPRSGKIVTNRRIQMWEPEPAEPANFATDDFPSLSWSTNDVDDSVGPSSSSTHTAASKWNRFSELRKTSTDEARSYMGADGSPPSSSSTEAIGGISNDRDQPSTSAFPAENPVDEPSTSTAEAAPATRKSKSDFDLQSTGIIWSHLTGGPRPYDSWDDVPASYKNDPVRQRITRAEERKRQKEQEFYKKQIRLNEIPIEVPKKWPIFVPECSLKAPKLPKKQKLASVEEFRRNTRFCEMTIAENGHRLPLEKINRVRDRWSKRVSCSIDYKYRMKPENSPLVMPLGPTACDSYNRQCSMDEKSKYNKDFTCLSNSSSPLVCLKMKKNLPKDHLSNDIYRDLKVDKVKAETFEFSHPRVPYMMEMRHGEPIKFISKEEDCKSALVVDDMAPTTDTEEYFSKKYNRNVKVSKLDSLMMKEYHRRNNISTVPSKNGFLITFESPEDKEACRAKERNFQNSDCSVVGAIDYSKTYNSVSLEIVYDSKQIRTKYAIITLANPNEIDFAQRALNINNLCCTFVNENNRLEESARYRKGNKKIFVYGLPRWCNTVQILNWYIDRILTPNRVQTERIEFFKAPADTFSFFRTSDAETYFLNQKAETNFRHQLIMHGGAAKMYRGALDAMALHREYDNDAISTISFRTEELPCIDPTGNEKRLAARFSDRAYELGVRAAKNLVNGMAKSVKCLMFNKGEYFGPRAYPKIRKMFPISKRVRIAFDDEITKLDTFIRNRTNDLGMAENNRTSVPFTVLLQTKFIEFYRDGEDEGLIGVEGWKKSDVDFAIQKLESIIKPVVLDCVESNCEELLYGFGESYANLVIDNHSPYAVADFDRFNRKISVYGRDAQKAIDEMKLFNERKHTLNVKTEILFNGAYLNNDLTGFFDGHSVWNIAKDLRCKIKVHEAHVEFDGALPAFEAFEAIVKSGNSAIYKKATSNLDKILHEPSCAVCTDSVSDDFYRLEACGHVYCRPCVNGLVQNSIMERMLPCKCLFEGCEEFIAPVDIKLLLLGGEDRIKALDAQKLQKLCNRVVDSVLLDSNSLIKACPTPDCNGLFLTNLKPAIEPKNDDSRASIAQCFNCDKRYCRNCLTIPHPDQNCRDIKRLREDAEFSIDYYVMKNSANVRRCPIETCRTVIQRNEGCNHMECSVCKSHFCWVCGFSADTPSAIYGHMTAVHGSFVGNVEQQ